MVKIKDILIEEFSQILAEGYDERLNQIVEKIINDYSHEGGEIVFKHLKQMVLKVATSINAPEVRMGDKMIAELVDDVKRALVKKGVFKKVSAQSPSRERAAELIRQLADAIQHYAGESFPDGDPIDRLGPWMEKEECDQMLTG
ncbi:MAG: hypothetical protein HC836_31795 [Richelia sp. RM2_1_2]|nr:hypothetical protein [Richelia sp. RM2_1_2]